MSLPKPNLELQRILKLAQEHMAGERFSEAERLLRQAACDHPTSVDTWFGLGCALTELGDHCSAINAYQTVCKLDATHGKASHNLARAMFEVGDVDQAVYYFQRAIENGCAKSSLPMLATVLPCAPSATNAHVLEFRKVFAKLEYKAYEQFSPKTAPKRDRPIRVGYVSGFLGDSNWMKPVWGLINHSNREQFENHFWSDDPIEEIGSEYLNDQRDRFHVTTEFSNREVASDILRHQIDILVDLNGYSLPRRLGLYAYKPAPRVLSWFNMFATSGISQFDVIVGDRSVIPNEEEEFYCERVLRLPCSYLTFDVAYDVPDVSEPPITWNGCFTFGSRSSQYKITPPTFDLWSNVLRAIPSSRFSLRNKALKWESLRQYVLDQFSKRGVSVDRITINGPADHYEFLQSYDEIDLAIDTLPYSGGTTSSEALWQGVPTLTQKGDRWAARTTRSILHHAGLGEFIADNDADLVRLAEYYSTELAGRTRLTQLRQNTRSHLKQSSVCDVAGLARGMEDIYRQLMATHEK